MILDLKKAPNTAASIARWPNDDSNVVSRVCAVHAWLWLAHLYTPRHGGLIEDGQCVRIQAAMAVHTTNENNMAVCSCDRAVNCAGACAS